MFFTTALASIVTLVLTANTGEAFRPPAVPLLTWAPMQQKFLFDANRLVNQTSVYWTGDQMGIDLLVQLSEPNFCGATEGEEEVDSKMIKTTFIVMGSVTNATYPRGGNAGFFNHSESRSSEYGTLALPLHESLVVGATTTTITYSATTSCQPKNHSLPPIHHDFVLSVKFVNTLLPEDLLSRSLPGGFVQVNVSLKRPLNTTHWRPSDYGVPSQVKLMFAMDSFNVIHLNPSNHTYLNWSLVPARHGPGGIRMGNLKQDVLGGFGDWWMEDWGFLHLHAASPGAAAYAVNRGSAARQHFSQKGDLPDFVPQDPANPIYRTNKTDPDPPVVAMVMDLKGVETEAVDGHGNLTTVASATLIAGYDEVGYQLYYGQNFTGYWTLHLPSDVQNYTQEHPARMVDALHHMRKHHRRLLQECADFDEALYRKLRNRYGTHYAEVTTMAYRQTFAAIEAVVSTRNDHGRDDPHSSVLEWSFLKEISSGGDVSTMDVIFPASPALLLFSPDTLKRLLKPILAFGNNETDTNYTDGWCPHQLGFYPISNATTKSQEPMPLEETGNMFLMLTGHLQRTNGTDLFWLPYYHSLLKPWAEWMVETQLPIPPLQLCTDDFTGPLYGNANLAAKGIISLHAFSLLCQAASGGNQTERVSCEKYSEAAKKFAAEWVEMAVVESGAGGIQGRKYNHTILAFNNSEFNQSSWSLKYNMVWQKLLGFADGEPFANYQKMMDDDVKFYRFFSNSYGYPLDSRFPFQKVDWYTWGATLQSSTSTFYDLFEDIYDMFDQTTDHLPLTDLYFVKSGKDFANFRSRPVIGALFAPMLLNKL